MQLTTLAVLFASLSAVCLASPADNHLEKRQTYIITCIGGHCDDGSTPVPSVVPKPTTTTTSKPSLPKSSTKPPPKPTPTKTTLKTTSKSTGKPTKTSDEGIGPSSTACPVPLYYQCGGYYDGKPWAGCTKCVKGATCVVQNEFYDQCVADGE